MRFSARVTVALSACLIPLAGLRAQGGSSLLVSARQLSRELANPALVLIYVGPKEDYDAGHVPGARFVEMQDLAAAPAPDRPKLELPAETDLRERLEKLGISDKSNIVVIPGADWGSPATRVVYTLQAAGLGSRTRLLEGGSGGWKRAGLATSTVVPAAAAPGKLTLKADRSIVVTHDWVQARLGTPGFHLIDARAPMFFEGPGMTDPRGMQHAAGHIPGAHNIPFNTLFNDSLEFLPRAELQRHFADAGVQPGDTVVAYCHIGQQATVVLFAARLTGHPIKLYDGSFTEWDSLKLPIENPTAPKQPDAGGRR